MKCVKFARKYLIMKFQANFSVNFKIFFFFYIDILKANLNPSADKLGFGGHYLFQQG